MIRQIILILLSIMLTACARIGPDIIQASGNASKAFGMLSTPKRALTSYFLGLRVQGKRRFICEGLSDV